MQPRTQGQVARAALSPRQTLTDHTRHQQQGSRNNRYDNRRGQKRSKPNVDPADIKIGGTERYPEFTDSGSIITCNKLEYIKATLHMQDL